MISDAMVKFGKIEKQKKSKRYVKYFIPEPP
jgi:hypothetical protein